MKYINNYISFDYNTPPELIIESLGISKLVKKYSDDIFNDINELPYQNTFKFKNKNIDVIIYQYMGDNIYGLSGDNFIEIKVPSEYNDIDLKRVITHELNHVNEILNRLDKNVKSGLEWKLTKNNMIFRNRYKEDSLIQELIYMMYIGSKHEMGSRVVETYTILMDKKTNNSDILYNELIKTSAWKYCEDLNNFDTNNYKINYDNLIKYLTDLNKNFKDVEFKIFKIPENENDCNFILDKWVKLFKNKHKKFKRKLTRMISEVINDYNNIIES